MATLLPTYSRENRTVTSAEASQNEDSEEKRRVPGVSIRLLVAVCTTYGPIIQIL